MQRTHLEAISGESATLALTASTHALGTRDLTGMTISFRLSNPSDRGQSALTASGSIVSAASGTYTVALTAAQTADLRGDYEFVAYATSGATVYGINHGRVRFLSGVEA